MSEQVCFAKKRQCDDSFDFFRPDDRYLVMRLAVLRQPLPVGAQGGSNRSQDRLIEAAFVTEYYL